MSDSAVADGDITAFSAPDASRLEGAGQLDLFDTGDSDALNRPRIFARLLQFVASGHIVVDGDVRSLLEWTPAFALRRLRLLERDLQQTNSSRTVVRLIGKEHYTRLNVTLGYLVSRQNIPGQTKNELIWFAHRMRERGCGLLGDIAQMTLPGVLRHACTVPCVRNPEKLTLQVEKVLQRLGLGLNMIAPGWNRVEPVTMYELIERRDERAEAGARIVLGGRIRPAYLRLIEP